MTIEQVLRKYGDDFVEELRRNIIEKGGVASGDLINNLSTSVDQVEADTYTLYLHSPDYLKWWDQGTMPHWMPVQPLKDWVQNKGIVPEERNGKLPTVDQLPYMIQHGIAEKGTPSHDVVNAVANLIFDRYEEELQEAMLDDLGYMLEGLPVKY